jgi:DNA-binding response OmpR family regulator
MLLPDVLVVDDDEWIFKAIQAALGASGCRVDWAYDGLRGLEIARLKKPDVIITDVVMPRLDGWAFVKQLRSMPEFALTPVIFLTSKKAADDLIRGFRLGADDYLPKPLNLQLLQERLGRALEERRRLEKDLAAPAPAGKGLQGTFDQIGLAAVLRVLELGRRSGILRLRREGDREEGLIYVVDGSVHRAELAGGKGLRNQESVYAMVGWSEGTFEFSPMPLRLADDVATPITQLLLEAARRIDEARAAK